MLPFNASSVSQFCTKNEHTVVDIAISIVPKLPPILTI